MNTDHFDQKLQEELRTIEQQLSRIARKNDTGQWEATAGTFEADPAEPEEEAQKFAEEENNQSIVDVLAGRLADVACALEKIAAGTYGTCEISGDRIEEERLEANPAARTCIAHKEEKDLPR